MSWFYEIRSSTNAVLKRDGGFATQNSAKAAAREDAKKMKNMRQPRQASYWHHLGRTECRKAHAVLI